MVNIHYLLSLRDMRNGYLSLKNNFAIESKKIYKGRKTLEKKSFLNNLELLFSAREKLLIT